MYERFENETVRSTSQASQAISNQRKVQLGERLCSRNPDVVRRSSVERDMPRRTANALHSYVTKASMYGERYDLLCQRALQDDQTVYIQEEEDEERELAAPNAFGEDYRGEN